QGYSIDLVIHPVVRVRRDEDGRLRDVLEPGARASDAISESVLHAEVAREPDDQLLARLRENVERVLVEVRCAVEDWGAMRDRVHEVIDETDSKPPPLEPREVEEVKAFLAWLAED